MKQIWMAHLLVTAFACSPKKPVPQSERGSVEAQPDGSDCPSGVKNGCNEPTLTQDPTATSNVANKKCFEACVSARQMEAIGHETIELECQRGCDEIHFAGQLEVAPDLANVPLQPPEDGPSKQAGEVDD